MRVSVKTQVVSCTTDETEHFRHNFRIQETFYFTWLVVKVAKIPFVLVLPYVSMTLGGKNVSVNRTRLNCVRGRRDLLKISVSRLNKRMRLSGHFKQPSAIFFQSPASFKNFSSSLGRRFAELRQL